MIFKETKDNKGNKMSKIYKRLPSNKANALIDWAEENNVDWDVWGFPSFSDSEKIELWLERWPEDYEE